MSARPPLAASEQVPLEILAATAQMLADRLVAAAHGSARPPQECTRLQLADAKAPHPAGDSLLSRTRCYLRARRLRGLLFPEGVFADPAWDMLLDLFACKLEGNKVCISDACMAASVPTTTALRWVNRLEQLGLVERFSDPMDSRRVYVELTETATCRVESWLKATFDGEAAA